MGHFQIRDCWKHAILKCHPPPPPKKKPAPPPTQKTPETSDLWDFHLCFLDKPLAPSPCGFHGVLLLEAPPSCSDVEVFFFLDAKSEPQLSNSHCFWIYQGTNISHLGKRKIIFKNDFWWDMSYVSYQEGNKSKNMKESHLATGFMKHRESGHGIIIWWYVVFLSAAWRRLQQEHWASLKHLPIEWVHEQLTAIKTVLWLKRISSWFVGWPLFIHSFISCLPMIDLHCYSKYPMISLDLDTYDRSIKALEVRIPPFWLKYLMILAKAGLKFHQAKFSWNQRIFVLNIIKPPFGVRSCEVAIFWELAVLSLLVFPQVLGCGVRNRFGSFTSNVHLISSPYHPWD